MSTPFQQIPIVDIAGLYSPDKQVREIVGAEMGNAAKNVGFMYIKGHHVPPQLISDLKRVSKEFFKLSMDEKMEYYIGKSKCHKGYVPKGEEIIDEDLPPDHKEALDLAQDLPLSHPKVKEGVPMHGPNVWPSHPPDLKQVVSEYYKQVYDLGQILVKGFALALKIDEGEFAKEFTESMAGLRLIHYPPGEESSHSRGMGAHCDYECFTILLADSPGLEVINSSNQWIKADPIDGCFVINTGDLLDVLTNGVFKATKHRVRKVEQERFSFPLFYGCNYNTAVKPLPHFINPNPDTGSKRTVYRDDNNNRYKDPSYTVVAGDHLWGAMIVTYKYLRIQLENNLIELPESCIR